MKQATSHLITRNCFFFCFVGVVVDAVFRQSISLATILHNITVAHTNERILKMEMEKQKHKSQQQQQQNTHPPNENLQAIHVALSQYSIYTDHVWVCISKSRLQTNWDSIEPTKLFISFAWSVPRICVGLILTQLQRNAANFHMLGVFMAFTRLFLWCKFNYALSHIYFFLLNLRLRYYSLHIFLLSYISA